MATTLISFFIILLVLILAHEFGHFISAKIFKIKVEEFGIFLPPRIWGIKRGETIYSINWLPLGGFVKLSGEEDPDALAKKKDQQKEIKKAENPDKLAETPATSVKIEKHSIIVSYIRSILWLPPSITQDTFLKSAGSYFNPLSSNIWDKNYHILPNDADSLGRLPTKVNPKSQESGTLAGKSIPVRLITLGAGSLMNILLPFLLLSIALMVPHQASATDIYKDTGEVLVLELAPNSPASAAGIKVGDTILTINNDPVRNVTDYEKIIGRNIGQEITLSIKHSDGSTADVKLTPRVQAKEGEGATGVAITTIVTKSYPFWKAIPSSVGFYWDILVALKDSIVQTIKGTVPFDVAGPVGIASVVGQVARTGISNLIVLAALISINLGIVNIFPIPSLDGGRIFFVLLEWVRHGKRVSPRTENLIHTIGFILLLALIFLVTFRDIMRLIG